MTKRNIYFLVVVFLLTALGGSIPIFAVEETASMMCDGGVVRIGDTDIHVQQKCGQPRNQSMGEWLYDFGPAQPVYRLIFKDGKVVRILEGTRRD